MVEQALSSPGQGLLHYLFFSSSTRSWRRLGGRSRCLAPTTVACWWDRINLSARGFRKPVKKAAAGVASVSTHLTLGLSKSGADEGYPRGCESA